MERYKRGTLVQTGRRVWTRMSAFGLWSRSRPLFLAGVGLGFAEETKHFKVIGTTGTGKSTAITELLKGALERGDRAIIADPDGGYLARFHERRRGDVILNPFDARSVKWNPLAEVHSAYDVDQLASGLIPSSEDASTSEWRAYARTFLSAVADHCHRAGECDVAELWRLLAIASPKELRKVVVGTPAQPFLDADNARMFGSIRSITGSAVAALAYVRAQCAASFSVREWVRSGVGSLFIPYRASQVAALRSIIATWMRLAIFEAMSCVEKDLHLWFVIDELDALGAIDGLKDALARLRKYGGRCVIGFQSIAQVTSTYGAGDAQTIVENCGNTLILRCSGSDNGGTAQFASRLIGDREIVRRQTTRGRDREGSGLFKGSRRSTNVSEQHFVEAAVMPSELEQLPDLSGFLKTASAREWRRVRISRPR